MTRDFWCSRAALASKRHENWQPHEGLLTPSPHSVFQFIFVSKTSSSGVTGLLIKVFGGTCLTLENPPVMDSLYVSSQNSYIEVLLHNVMVLEGEAFGKYEDGAPMMGLVPIQEGVRDLALLSATSCKKADFCKKALTRNRIDQNLDLGLPTL